MLIGFNFILSILSYFIPKKKNQILLGSFKGRFFGNPKFFFLYLCKNPNQFKPFWITGNKETFQMLKERKLPVIYLYSWKGFVAILLSEYLVFSYTLDDVSYGLFLFGRFNKIDTWHGTPLKKVGIKTITKNPTLKQKIMQKLFHKRDKKSRKLILASSENVKKILSKEFENNHVEVLGYPRNDVFFNSNLVFEDYNNKLNLKKYKKIILYCPTYRDIPSSKIPFSQNFLKKLDAFLMEQGYLFLIKRHEMDRNLKNTQSYRNIIDITKDVQDIQDLLVHVDILITDYSSVFFDFALCNKPLIFYPYDFDEYIKNSRDMYFEYFEEFPGPFVYNEDELLECIKSIDDAVHETKYQTKYETFKNKFNFYQDGKSSERLIKWILNN